MTSPRGNRGRGRGLLMVLLCLALMLVITVPQGTVLAAQSQKSGGAAASSKMDRIVLADGREFVGDITEESDESVTIIVEVAGIRGSQTFPKSQILQIEHDKVARSADAASDRSVSSDARADNAELAEVSGRIVYVLPIRGLWGFDVYTSVVQNLWDEAIDAGAKTIVLEFDAEQGLADLEMYRDFFEDLKRDAREQEIEVVVWVKRAHHLVVAFALMWEDIYFHPDGSMGRGQMLDLMLKAMWSDEAVRQKMIAAWVGILRGMAVEGGYSAELCEAMIRPELLLSYDYEGDHAIFYADDTTGEFVADSDPQLALDLTADDAARFAVSKGTARTLSELMFTLGHREFYHYEGRAVNLVESWIDGIRAAQLDLQYILADIDRILGGGGGEDPRMLIGQAIRKWEEVRKIVRRYPPLQNEYPEDTIDLEIERLRKQIQDMNRQRRGMPGGGGGGRPGGGGG